MEVSHSGPPRLAPYPKQRARNAGPLGLLGVSLLATEATGDSGSGTGNVGDNVRPIGSGHAAEIDLASGGSGGRNSVTPVELKQSAIEIVSTPANWPLDTMLNRNRARAMKRMTDKFITDSAHKKACTVHTALANNIETYVSIVRDMILGAPSLQDVLKVCLTQASLEAKK